MTQSPALICDLDGCLIVGGEVNSAVAEIVSALYDSGWEVVFLTDRGVRRVDMTSEWLSRNGFVGHLHLRGDEWGSEESYKRHAYRTEIAHRFDVRLVLDDNPAVVRMFRELGVPAFQVANDDGNPLPAVPVV